MTTGAARSGPDLRPRSPSRCLPTLSRARRVQLAETGSELVEPPPPATPRPRGGGIKRAFLSDFLFPINLVSVLTKKACLALMDCFPLGRKKNDNTGTLEFLWALGAAK